MPRPEGDSAVADDPDPLTPTIRPATPADLDFIIALDRDMTGMEKPEYWRGIYDRFGKGSEGCILVAYTDDRFVGFIVGEVRAWEFGSPPCGWVFALGVPADLRVQGVGTALFEGLCDKFRAAGVKTIRTMLARDARLLMSFFRSQGMMGGPLIQLEKELAG
jgi:GNAT superfamily N-acetyltransferase